MVLPSKLGLAGATWADEIFQRGYVHPPGEEDQAPGCTTCVGKILEKESETEYPELQEE